MTITIEDDFDLEKIIDSGQCFRAQQREDGTFRFITGSHVLYIKALQDNHYTISCTEEEWQQIWYSYFDLARSYSAVRTSIPLEDSFLTAAANEAAGLRILQQDPFEMLITFILSQRKSIPAIKYCVEALCTAYGTPIHIDFDQTDCNACETSVSPGNKTPDSADAEFLYLFPTPEQLHQATEQELRNLKSGYRAPYVMDAADAVYSGMLDLNSLNRFTDEELLEVLKTVRGVGVKVANCVALFACGRTGMAPIDTWIRQIIDTEYNGRNPFPDYGENAGIMQQYMFYYAIHHKKDVHEHRSVSIPSGK